LFEDQNSVICDAQSEFNTTQPQSANHKAIGYGVKRGRMEIIAEILFFCKKKRVKTNIMSKTNVNYTRLKKQLNFLTDKGMLSYSKGKYYTTDRGHRFLELFIRLCSILDTENV
jgi:predicted transcriptional regulator